MAEKTEHQKLEQATSDKDLKHVMGTPQGRRFMQELLDFCHIFHTSFTGSSETYFKEGERNVGLMLIGRINRACPESYTAMQRERNERDKRKEQREESKKGNHDG